MHVKFILRLKRTLWLSPASLAQSSWSFLAMALVMGGLHQGFLMYSGNLIQVVD